MLSLIYARSLNHCIGDNGQVPWDLPDEFAHFEKTTLGKPVIMGRKTYEDHLCVLPGRLNIVVSRQADYSLAQGVELAPSLEAALTLAKSAQREVFVIGGVGLYCAALPLASTVYETIVETRIEGDTMLPEFDFSAWDTLQLQQHPADEHHQHAFSIYRHRRRTA